MYKGIYYWHNGIQGKWLAQIGYEIIAEARTMSGIKKAITRHLKA